MLSSYQHRTSFKRLFLLSPPSPYFAPILFSRFAILCHSVSPKGNIVPSDKIPRRDAGLEVPAVLQLGSLAQPVCAQLKFSDFSSRS